jgi:glutaredoxin-related protein
MSARASNSLELLQNPETLQESSLAGDGARRTKGNLRFDRRFRELDVPRLQVSAMTRDRDLFQSRNELVTRCAAQFPDVIRALARNEIDIEEVEAAERQSNLKHFLREKREKRDTMLTASEHGEDSVGHVLSLPTAVIEPVTAVPAEEVVAANRLRAPLLETLLQIVASMSAIKPDSRRRYATSLVALKGKLGVFALAEDHFDVLASIDPAVWAALREAAKRRFPFEALRQLLALRPTERKAALRAQGRKLRGPLWVEIEEMFSALQEITAVEWNALSFGGDLLAAELVVAKMDEMTPEQRGQLRKAAQLLLGDAPVRAMEQIQLSDWVLMSSAWCGSGADWNHLRRSLSACLTTLFDDDPDYPFRRRVIRRIPLKPEEHRVPDLNVQAFRRIVEALPPEARQFLIALVLTGARIGEYLRLGKEHLLPLSYQVKIPGTKTQGSASHVQVTSDMWHYVENAVPAPFRYGKLRRLFIDACAACGIPNLVLHDLRHFHAQWAAKNGASLSAIQRSLRHGAGSVTGRYADTLNLTQVATAIATELRSAGFGAPDVGGRNPASGDDS